MKILLVSDYFYPFTPGGSEWSVYELARALKKNNVEVVIATLNYGAKTKDVYRKVKVIRIPFLKKLQSSRSVVNPIWQNNPFFFISSAYHLFRIVKSENPNIIHIHGKFLIPASIIVGFLSRKPTIITSRDKQILCSIGKCFFDPNRLKACSFWEYLTSDFLWFYANYVSKNLFALFYSFIGAVWSRIAGSLIKFFARCANKITAISNSQKKYLEANGFKDVQVIYNTARFTSPKVLPSKTKTVLFVGKLSKGKGVELLLDAAEDMLKEQKINFLFAGNLESQKIKSRLQEKVFKNQIKILGGIDYHRLPALYHQVTVAVMPSIYPESFGRAVLEAISCGTPVVVTNIGALPEIVEDKVTGRVVEPSKDNLKEAILDIINNEKKYRQNINKDYAKLKEKFMRAPLKEYLKLYKEQLK
ncbi:hypothetical protein A2697_01655 [Candidatus Curtissbacteria bacterium RIFCSPHIGHO2_01_FULL_41_44]|uniref:Glycosyl transferase family 1 domain-containing protein n=1 Tax=Candidatus Curtissbacteria bacterium RIFCSPLOWO2_01_FULL_42_50 TaxID=1797730 RepID=A0A1F5H635_9BACT|nr:MAG: hypothetical protein A2697_01655 [Candidatus Curtissbacteria bacterium RIFCSPHIGHO2_01_FULL_41_44]OGD99636.1 MAG: hypothetical protein A3B54_03030 [Candidatus Curtissbacteria bacterium RIFCSPLOWO2_01_FULL_42_50]